MNRIFTEDEVLRIGLLYAGFNAHRQQRVERATCIGRFKSQYSSSPLVCAKIWEDLVTSPDIWENRTHPAAAASFFEKFLMALYFLKSYPTEERLAAMWKTCEKSARKWVWFFVEKIQSLKGKKIVWPEAWSASEQNFLYTVDGVHCRTNEIIHPTLAKNTKLYSHKFNQAGFDYELAISIFDDALVWINGPFLGSKHDITIFREDGLKETTPQGKKGIADKGYRGEKGILCTPNSQDTVALRKFKNRARARHETFNARIKCFASLDTRFRHGMKKHKSCFEAACVIVQYQLENGSPLFDV